MESVKLHKMNAIQLICILDVFYKKKYWYTHKTIVIKNSAVYLLLSCSICWTEPDLRRPSGVAADVGRCQVVVRLM